MQNKHKITAAAAMAALTVPGAALAHDGGKSRDGARSADSTEQRSKHDGKGTRGESRGDHRGWKKHRGWKHRAFVLAGVDAQNLTVTDGKLAGPLTVDPVMANKGAKRLLDLTKAEIRGEDTVTFGTAGDGVVVRYKGLESTDTIQATDVVKVYGKVSRSDGSLDIKAIKVLRPEAQTQTQASAKAKTKSKHRDRD